MLIDGRWLSDDAHLFADDGSFRRPIASVRHRVTAAYGPVFGCDHRPLADYSRLSAYLRDLRARPGVGVALRPDDDHQRAYAPIPFAWANRAVRVNPRQHWAVH